MARQGGKLLFRGRPVETGTFVAISENVHVTHEIDSDGSVTLVFRGSDQLSLSCTPRAFTTLVDAVSTVRTGLVT